MARLDRLIELMVSSGVVEFGDFVLTSGSRSPVYIDMRRALGVVELRELVVKLSLDVLSKMEFESVAGIVTGGLPWAAIFADHLGKPLAYVRTSRKQHGLGKAVEGFVGEHLYLVVDDVATTGGSLARAIEALRGVGGSVREAFVLVDRGQGASERLRSMGVTLVSLTSLRDVVNVGYRLGLIDGELREKVYLYMGW